MKLLITGATGLIASKFINDLLTKSKQISASNNYTIIALSRNSEKAKWLLGNAVNVINNLDEVDFNSLDVVINLAGEPIADKRWCNKQKKLICDSRWQMTQQISDKIKQCHNPPHTFISGSAIGYYGRQSDDEITEDFTQIHDEFTHTVCKKWESIAMQAHSVDTRVCLIRTGIVLDKNKGALAKMLPAFKFGLGGPISHGQQIMSWIHIDDMVNILVELINNKSLHGAINATAPHPVSNKEFSKALSYQLYRPCIFRVPKVVLKLLLGELADLVLYGQNVVPAKLQLTGFHFKFNHLDEALHDLLNTP